MVRPHPVMQNSIFEPFYMARKVAARSIDPPPLEGLEFRRREMSLNGEWRYRPDPNEAGEGEKWFSRSHEDWDVMNVPSNYGIEDKSLQNFFNSVWFERDFEFEGDVTKIVFEGVDYFADVWLNGRKLGSHEGYFCPFQFYAKLKGQNLISVRVRNPWDDGVRFRGALMGLLSFKKYPKGILNFHDCRPGDSIDAYDSQSMGTGGIYRPVRVISTGSVTIDCVFITPLADSKISVDYVLTNHGREREDFTLVSEVDGLKKAYGLEIPHGSAWLSVEHEIQDPRLWFPWDHPELGSPELYTLRSYVIRGDECLDHRYDRFGMRKVELGGKIEGKGDSRAGKDAYHWRINGKRIFIRGTNIIPTEWMGYVDRDFYMRDCRMLKECNFNMVRVHAHLQPPIMYDVFDEEGMMVFQDFTLQWAYENSWDFIEKCKRMMAEMIYLYYNHPCIALWCCHNEPPWALAWAISSKVIGRAGVKLLAKIWCSTLNRISPRFSGNKVLDDELYELASTLDQTRPVHKGSGWGDSHTYSGWYIGMYTDVTGGEPFPTEYGAQAIPLSFKKYVDAEKLWPPDEYTWRYHDAQLSILRKYVGDPSDYSSFEEYAMASQIYQAMMCRYYVERHRMCKYNPTGGSLHFMFVNWWPSVAWGIVDHERNPMVAYEYIRNSNSPVLVCAKLGAVYKSGMLRIPVWVINDLHKDLGRCEIEWSVWEVKDPVVIVGRGRFLRKPITVYGGTPLRKIAGGKLEAYIPEDCSLNVGCADVELKDGAYEIRLQMRYPGGSSSNRYWILVV